MKVLSLHLINFRGIAELRVDFTERTTAFVGINGVGKSAILDALAIALSQLIWRINGNPQKARPIALDDIRQGTEFARISMTVHLRGREVQWAITKNRKAGQNADPLRKSALDALNEAAKKLVDLWDHVESDRFELFDLPLAVYYDVNRAVLDIPIRVREQLLNNPYEAYRDALDHGGADFKRFFIWFRNQEDFENEQRRDHPEFRDLGLEAVRTAVEVFTGFRELRIRRTPLRMTVVKQELELNVALLSDGERNMLALVGDMARRLRLLNPSLVNPNEGQGVVLIDEIDLHLHPGWQRSVASSLERTFPNCQFIITTHSPQVVSELVEESVYLLRDGQGLGHPQASYGLTSSHVLEEVMESRARPAPVESKLAAVFESIERSELIKAKAQLKELREAAPGIPELLGAEALLRRKEVLGR